VDGVHPTLATVCLDCADAHEMAAFYGRLLGWEVTRREPEWVLMRNPDGGTGLSFQAEAGYVPPMWPERADQQQKMIHLDLWVRSGQPADLDRAVAAAVDAGARLAEHQPQDDVRVLFDPAGHPFCLFLD